MNNSCHPRIQTEADTWYLWAFQVPLERDAGCEGRACCGTAAQKRAEGAPPQHLLQEDSTEQTGPGMGAGISGMGWKLALPEPKASRCFAGAMVLPAASLRTWGRCHRGSADDTNPSSKTETCPAFPAEQESTWNQHGEATKEKYWALAELR